MSKFLTLILLNILMWQSQALAKVSLDVNDVSYMWPPVLSDAGAAQMISLNEVISESLFQEIVSYAQGASLQGRKLTTPVPLANEAARFNNWRIVSLRIDPCAPNTVSNTTCLQEVRLVAQPFSFDGVWTYYDFSFHVVFKLSEGSAQVSKSFQELLTFLLSLKDENQNAGISTAGLPLKIHPGFKRKSFAGELKTGLLSRLKSYPLEKITFTGAESEKGPWVFFQGLIQDNHYQPQEDPTLRGSLSGEIKPEMPGQGGVLTPVPTNTHWPFAKDQGQGVSIADLFFNGDIDLKRPAHLADGSESQIFKMEDIVHAVNNPTLTNRNNTDCMSCHASMSRGLMLNLVDQENPFKYQAPNDHVTLTAQARNLSPTNFRVFGWFGSTPVIADRVIHESAAAADAIERMLNQTETKN